MRTLLLTLSLSLIVAPALAQVRPAQTQQATTGPLMLAGTSYGLPWGLYAGGPTDKTDGDSRLRLSTPEGVKVLGTKYDPETTTLLVTYRSNLNVRQSVAFALQQLEQQGFEVGNRRFPSTGRAEATLSRTERVIDIQGFRGPNGVTNLVYTFDTLQTLMPDNMAAQVQRLLSGTTDGQPWSLINMPPTQSMLNDNRIYVSAPHKAKVVGYRYDAANRNLYLTYRSHLDARTALAFASGELAAQNFVISPEDGATATTATANHTREGYPVKIQVGSQAGLVSVVYTLGGN